jgi:tetratricopeptide (TPR) repeat protein
MDRTALARCALLLAPLAACAGCGAKQEAPPTSPAPLVLAELQSQAPGPWRAGTNRVAPASLEQADTAWPPVVTAPSGDAGELEQRMRRGPAVSLPLEGEMIEPVAESPGASPADAPSMLDLAPVEMSPQTIGPAEVPPGPPETGPVFESSQPAADAAQGAPGAGSGSAEPRTLEEILAPSNVQSERLPTTIAPLPEERGQLPWADSQAGSAEMNSVLEQAEQRLREGFRLADRQAIYLARAEFIAALELISQANDLRHNTPFYSQALVAGLTALDESRDFARARPTGKPLEVARIASGHKTKIMSSEECATISPVAAAKRYYAYAQEQLAGACAGEPRSSIALYGLGRLAMAAGDTAPAERMEHSARAMVLHQAALMADRNNFRAANELGVLLARHGDYASARTLLLHSVRLSPHPSTYRNLVVVHSKLGEKQLASEASQLGLAMERAGVQRKGPAIAWVDPATFAGTAQPTTTTSMPPVAQSQPAAKKAEEKPAAETAEKNFSDWLPWKMRR